MTHEQYAELIKIAALDIGKREVQKYLVKQLPMLGSTILSPIVAFVVGYVLTIAIKETELGLFFLYTDLRVNGQGRAFTDSALNYEQAKLKGDKDVIARAETELINSLRTLVRFST